jgi:tripartite-type tricarboxylate transporter receptor subunit TctC
MVHVPYKGTAPALQGVMANDIQILVDVPSSLMPHVRSGKIKALGMFSKARVGGAPEVPTVAEAGGPAIESATWVAFLAPANTPREIVARVAQEVAKAVNAPDSASSRWASNRSATPDQLRSSSTTRSRSGRRSSIPPE